MPMRSTLTAIATAIMATIAAALRQLQAWLLQALPRPTPVWRPVPIRIERSGPSARHPQHRIR